MNRERYKEARLRDFEERSSWNPADVISMETDISYISIHPFADDPGTLKRINWHPEGCVKVDGYVRAHGDVGFLQVETTMEGESAVPGLYARVQPYPNHGLNVMMVLPVSEKFVTQSLFEAGVASTAKLLQPGSALSLTAKLVRLTEG